MKLLLKHGADPNIPTFAGTTALMAAAGVNWVFDQTYDEGQPALLEAVKLCVELGMDINAINSMGLTAMHGAANRGSDEIIKYLVVAWREGERQGQGRAHAAHLGRGRLPGDNSVQTEAELDRADQTVDVESTRGAAVTRHAASGFGRTIFTRSAVVLGVVLVTLIVRSAAPSADARRAEASASARLRRGSPKRKREGGSLRGAATDTGRGGRVSRSRVPQSVPASPATTSARRSAVSRSTRWTSRRWDLERRPGRRSSRRSVPA